MSNSTITGNTSKAVERHLGHSYKTVLEVSKNLKEIKQLGPIAEHVVVTGSNIEAIKIVATNIGDVNNVSDNMEYVKDVAAGIEGLPVVSYIGSEPPAQPVEGATWYCTTDGRTYVWYKDIDSYQWVESSPQSIAKEDVRTPIVARAALERALLLDGYTLVTGSFELGATLTKATDVILQEVTGKVYSWGGSFPATVPTGSTPDSTGGIGSNTWTLRSVPEVLKRIEAEEADTQDWKGFTEELLAQAGTTDNGQPDKLGASQRVDAMSKIYGRKFANVDEMLAFNKLVAGRIYSTGGTTWEYLGHTGQISIKYFRPIGYVHAVDFGLKPDDNAAASANFVALRNAVMACLLDIESSVWDAIEVQKVLKIDAGEYFIRGNSPLRIPGAELVNSGSLSGYRRGFRVVGDGVQNTILTMMSDSGSDCWFYDSTQGETPTPTWGYQYNSYSGITFRDDKYRTNPLDARPAGQKVNGWLMNSTGWEGWFEWDQCQFESLDTVIKLTGSANDDHGRWNNCKFQYFRDDAFYVDNNQAVALQLIGSEMIGSGNFFNIKSGGWMQVDGSSIICYEPTVNGKPDKSNTNKRAFLKYAPSSNGGSFRNQKFIFTGLTFETYDINHLTVMASGNNYGASIEVQFNSCSWATESAYDAQGNLITTPWERRTAVSLEGEHSAWITFNKCDLQRRHEYVISNKTQPYSTSWVKFTDCIIGWQVNLATAAGGSLANRCKLTSDRGAFQAVGTSWFQQSEAGSEYKMFALDFNKILSAQKSRFNPMTFEHRLMDSAAGTWPDTNGNAQRLVLPEGALVVKSEIYKPAWAPTAPTANYGISLRKSSDSSVILVYGGATPNGSEGRQFFEDTMITSPFKASEYDSVYLTLSGSASQAHPKDGYCSIFYK